MKDQSPSEDIPLLSVSSGLKHVFQRASNDAEFRLLLLENRAEAAESLEIKLSLSEQATLGVMSQYQMEAIIGHAEGLLNGPGKGMKDE